jgi:hypothetical protein
MAAQEEIIEIKAGFEIHHLADCKLLKESASNCMGIQ